MSQDLQRRVADVNGRAHRSDKVASRVAIKTVVLHGQALVRFGKGPRDITSSSSQCLVIYYRIVEAET